MNDKNRVEAIIKAINAVSQDTVIPRKDERLFQILLAQHMISNGFPEEAVDPELVMLSIRDAFHEYNWIKETNPEPTIETVFTKQYINKLKQKGWIVESDNSWLE